MPYATLEQMRNMEFGVTGRVEIIEGIEYELLTDGEFYGWAAKHGVGDDWTGDWDRVPEDEVVFITKKV